MPSPGLRRHEARRHDLRRRRGTARASLEPIPVPRVAPGHGMDLKRAVLQIQTERVAAIILSIVVLVLISEVVSACARDRVMKMK